MPDPALLSDLSKQHLATLPPVLRDSPDYQGVIHALARETERLEGFIENARAQTNPSTATTLLKVHEAMVRTTIEPVGATVDSRRAIVEARLRKMLGGGEGREWVDQVTALVGPGWDYAEHDPADGTSPAEGTLRISLPFAPSGSRYADSAAQIREVTPAHLELEFVSTGGFLLDQSQMDVEGLGV